jgi:tetrachlorobenzoquinone reductase
MSPSLLLRLNAIRYAARQTLTFELAAPDDSVLPPAEPGAHIGVHLPDGMVRQYSLLHTPEGTRSYEIGVKLDPAGRGGSRFMHESLRVGTVLPIDLPRNNFPLAQEAIQSIFFAGGIGITPIVAMIERLARLGRPAQLYYAVRQRDELAFLDSLRRICVPQVHVDEESGGRFMDLPAVIDRAPREAHLYCCGPAPMLDAFEAATRGWPSGQIHTESFTPRVAAATEGGYTVALARSGLEFRVPPGKSILAVLREGGVQVPASCEEGVCATCETRVVAGIPDHRDSILSAQERAGGRTMMICVSGSKGPRLVLDL